MRVKWAPFCNFRGPYSKKSAAVKSVLLSVMVLNTLFPIIIIIIIIIITTTIIITIITTIIIRKSKDY